MAEKGKGGRPLKFKSVEELQEKINDYFENCDNHETTFVTKEREVLQIPDSKPYTITGLALWLDTTRETLLDYENKDEFSDTIRKAKLKCENYAEESLWKPKIASGVIFNLINNYGWANKAENKTELTGANNGPLEFKWKDNPDGGG
jgi:hypothetical protein